MAVYGITRATDDIDLLVEERAVPGFRFNPRPMTFKDGGIKIYRLVKTEGEDSLLLDLLVVTPQAQPAWDRRREVETEFGPVCVVSADGPP